MLPLDDGAVLSLAGVELTVRHAPGHTQGSVMFSVDLDEAPGLLAGDVLFAGSVGGSTCPAGRGTRCCSLRDVVLPLDDETVVLPGRTGHHDRAGGGRPTRSTTELLPGPSPTGRGL